MARGHLVFALSVILSFRHSVILSFRHSVIPSHQSLSSQLLLHPCMDLNETWQGCCTTSFVRHSVIPSFRHSVIPSFRHSVASKFVFSTPPTSLHGFEWNLAGILYHKSRSACGEIIHVQQISTELWPLTLRIFTHFSLSSQLLLHPCMDLNETWQGCYTTSLEVHVGR